MISAGDILRENGIVAKTTAIGEFYVTCPRCSYNRKKKTDKCLSVKIDDKGVRWNCHHCDWQGGKFYERPENPRKGKGQGDNITLKADANSDRAKIARACTIFTEAEARDPTGTIFKHLLGASCTSSMVCSAESFDFTRSCRGRTITTT